MTGLRSRRPAWPWIALLLAIALGAISLAALTLGAAETTSQIVMNIRAPRIVMAVLIGAGLGLAGAAMQGSLGNPLADPALVGVSAGAALGVVAAASIGVALGSLGAGLAATIGAAAAVVVVVAASFHDSRPEVVTLLLAGVAVTAFAGSLLAVIVSLSPSAAGRSLTFWSSGSLALSTWSGVLSVLPFVVAGAVLAASVSHSLDVLSLGDRGAIAAGISVTSVRYRALGATVLLVGAGVGAVGVIAFVGLLVPHAVRAIIGPRHAPLMVLSALAGAILLLVSDTIARTVANPVEVPIGAITALIGAPAFFVLLRRTRARQGGWA
jgi:iron complex transport system permease protein